MLTSGDVVELDLGMPADREAGFRRPAVLVTAQRILDTRPSVVHIVPLTGTIRRFGSEVPVEPDGANGVDEPSAAQCQHIRAVSAVRVDRTLGNVGAAVLAQIRDVLALVLDIPS